eukprot:s28_g4.t1
MRSLDSMSTQQMTDSAPRDGMMASQSPTTPTPSPTPSPSLSLADALSKSRDQEDAKHVAYEWFRDEGNDHEGGAGAAQHLVGGALKLIHDFVEIQEASKAAVANFADVSTRCDKAVVSMKGKVDAARLEKWKCEKLQAEELQVSKAQQAVNDAADVLDAFMVKVVACFESDETLDETMVEDPSMVEIMTEMRSWLLEDEKKGGMDGSNGANGGGDDKGSMDVDGMGDKGGMDVPGANGANGGGDDKGGMMDAPAGGDADAKALQVQHAPNLELGYQDNLTEIQERWRNDPDVVMRSDGNVHFIGPGGRQESVEEHVGRLKHNSRMRFNRQIRGQRKDFLQSLFEDYVQSNESWLDCSFYLRTTRSRETRLRGKHKMMTYKDVRDKFGPIVAASIYDEKKKMQQNKAVDDPNTYWMEHPDVKGQQDTSH